MYIPSIFHQLSFVFVIRCVVRVYFRRKPPSHIHTHFSLQWPRRAPALYSLFLPSHNIQQPGLPGATQLLAAACPLLLLVPIQRRRRTPRRRSAPGKHAQPAVDPPSRLVFDPVVLAGELVLFLADERSVEVPHRLAKRREQAAGGVVPLGDHDDGAGFRAQRQVL